MAMVALAVASYLSMHSLLLVVPCILLTFKEGTLVSENCRISPVDRI